MKAIGNSKGSYRSMFRAVSLGCGALLALQACSSEPLAEDELSGPVDAKSVAGSSDGADAVEAAGAEALPSAEAAGTLALNEAETAALVEEYLFKPVDKEEATKIQKKVRSLDRETARRFHRMALDRGVPTPEQRKLAEASLQYAESKGVSFLDLRNDDLRQVFARTYGIALERVPLNLDERAMSRERAETQENIGENVARVQQAAVSCWPWESACGFTSSWSSGATPTICSGNCSPGIGWDRTGNSPCEVGGCDTRVWFNRASASFVDGVTAGADCVISWYGALGKYSAAGRTYIGYGQLGPTSCLFFPANPAANFQVK
jgi:hypothetical protein